MFDRAKDTESRCALVAVLIKRGAEGRVNTRNGDRIHEFPWKRRRWRRSVGTNNARRALRTYIGLQTVFRTWTSLLPRSGWMDDGQINRCLFIGNATCYSKYTRRRDWSCIIIRHFDRTRISDVILRDSPVDFRLDFWSLPFSPLQSQAEYKSLRRPKAGGNHGKFPVTPPSRVSRFVRYVITTRRYRESSTSGRVRGST